jgi:hypothetical protein
MKYVVRRIVAGVIAIPVVAGTYTALYLFLLLAGGEPNATIDSVFSTGVVIGITLALMLVFYPQFSRFLDKLI